MVKNLSRKNILLLSGVVFMIAILVGSIFYIESVRPTRINEITSHPRNYVDKNVTVEGKVTNVFSLAVINYFELEDATGKINIITKKPLPELNENLKVMGKVDYYAITSFRTVVLVEE